MMEIKGGAVPPIHTGFMLVSITWHSLLFPEQLSSLTPTDCPHLLLQAISGPLAAATASTLTNPMDVIRTRVQVGVATAWWLCCLRLCRGPILNFVVLRLCIINLTCMLFRDVGDIKTGSPSGRLTGFRSPSVSFSL